MPDLASHLFLFVGFCWSGWANWIWCKKPCYDKIEEIILKRNTQWYRKKYCLLVIISMIFSLRAFILTFFGETFMALTERNGRQLSALAFIDEIFGRDDGNIPFFTLIHGFFFTFNAINQGFFHFTEVDTPVWMMFHDILIRNFKYCTEAEKRMTTRYKFIVATSFRKSIESSFYNLLPERIIQLIIRYRVWKNQAFLDKDYLMEQKFSLFPEFVFDFRRRARIYLDLIELYNLGTLHSYWFAFSLMFHYYYHSFTISPSIDDGFWFVLFVIDSSLASFYCINSVCSGLMMCYASFFGSVFYCAILSPANARLKRNVNSYRVGIIKTTYYVKEMKKFLTDYTRMCFIVRFVNDSLWGMLVLVGFGINLPINIYFLSSVVIYKPSGVKLYVCIIVLIIQFVILLTCLLPSALMHNKFHASHKTLPKAIFALPCGKQYLGFRIKFLACYERASSRSRKYGIRVGPMSIISHWIVFKTGTLYLAYFLTFMNTIESIKYSALNQEEF